MKKSAAAFLLVVYVFSWMMSVLPSFSIGNVEMERVCRKTNDVVTTVKQADSPTFIQVSFTRNEDAQQTSEDLTIEFCSTQDAHFQNADNPAILSTSFFTFNNFSENTPHSIDLVKDPDPPQA